MHILIHKTDNSGSSAQSEPNNGGRQQGNEKRQANGARMGGDGSHRMQKAV